MKYCHRQLGFRIMRSTDYETAVALPVPDSVAYRENRRGSYGD